MNVDSEDKKRICSCGVMAAHLAFNQSVWVRFSVGAHLGFCSSVVEHPTLNRIMKVRFFPEALEALTYFFSIMAERLFYTEDAGVRFL